MHSFKSFFKQYIEDIVIEPSPRLIHLWEMARVPKGSEVNIFDDDDQVYYKHIYDNMGDFNRENRDAGIAIMLEALQLRYAAADNTKKDSRTQKISDSPYRNVVLSMADRNEDYIKSYTFGTKTKAKVEKVKIENIPMFPKKLIQKVYDAGYNWMPGFGFKHGDVSSARGKNAATAYYEFFHDNVEVSGVNAKYSVPEAFKIDAAPDAMNKYLGSRQGRSREETKPEGQISKKKIHLDKEDNNYLDSVEEAWRKIVSSPSKSDVAALRAAALRIRYSNYFIEKNRDGDFVVKPNFSGKVRSDITFKFRHKNITLKDVYVNADQLVNKFEENKLGQDFVKKPLTMTKASNWLKNKVIEPNRHYKSSLRDDDFYKAIKEDYNIWLDNPMDADTLEFFDLNGVTINSPTLLKKLKISGGGWRDDETGTRIVQPPNVPWEKMKRKNEPVSWDQLIDQDIKAGIEFAINAIGNKRYGSVDSLRSWVAEDANRSSEMESEGWLELQGRKSGEEPSLFRDEYQRIVWVSYAVADWIIKTKEGIKQTWSDKEGGNQEDFESGDAARSGGDLDGRDTNPPDEEVIDSEIRDLGDEDYEAMWDNYASQQISQQSKSVPATLSRQEVPSTKSRPRDIPLPVWMRITPHKLSDAKLEKVLEMVRKGVTGPELAGVIDAIKNEQ